MAEDLQDSIRENASGPKRAKGDSAEVEQHSLPDQIAADKYLAGKAALGKRNFGLTRAKIVPPGTV